MSPLALAAINLRARPARTALLALIVALALGAALTLLTLVNSMEFTLRQGSAERGSDLAVAQRDAADLLSGNVSEALGERIKATPGVAAVTGELATFAPIDEGRQGAALGWTEDAHFWATLPMAEGRKPTRGDRRVAVLGQGAAASYGKAVGDLIEIFGEPFRVIGISASKSALNRSVVLLPLADLQEVAFRQGQVTGFQLTLAPGADAERVRTEIEKLGRLIVTPTERLLDNDRNHAFVKAIANATSIIALGMGGLSLFSALLMAVHERRRDIGVLAALGWSRGRIRASILAEGAIIGALGGALAAPITVAAARAFRALPTIGEFLAFDVSPLLLTQGVAASIALCVLGSLYPAIQATRVRPAQALRAI